MQKKTKGSLAVAAGLTMLLGSGATFALWTDADTLAQDNVGTGALALTAGDLAWTWTHVSHEGAVTVNDQFVPDTQRLAPGDAVVGVLGGDALDITLVGATLRAELTLDGQPLSGDIAPLVWSVTGEDTLTVGNAADHEIVVTIGFPASATDGMDQTIDLSGLELRLTQEIDAGAFTG